MSEGVIALIVVSGTIVAWGAIYFAAHRSTYGGSHSTVTRRSGSDSGGGDAGCGGGVGCGGDSGGCGGD
ncbi:hypothetical protein [Streptomyces sp. NBC_01244]|uniref:hypothetical protein n=1 Tax=Streptomyces sp. NBC_01244 TaxID=2903797 RepID=UPI002E11615D|nr:hypothetical protein OG247_11905 [Streptomyces sp. NBC_01244]